MRKKLWDSAFTMTSLKSTKCTKYKGEKIGKILKVTRKYKLKSQCSTTAPKLQCLKLKRPTIPSTDEDVEYLELSYIVDGNTEWYDYF